MALRDDIKAFVKESPPAVLAVPTPEIPSHDGQIFVGRVSPQNLARHWRDADGDDDLNERAKFVQQVACDSAGSRIFQAEDVMWLSTCELLTPMVERLYWAGRYHNGLTDKNRTAWEKNSKSTAGSGSPSCCAEPSTPASAST